MTDGNGPEVFTPCAQQWVNPDNTEKDSIGKFVNPEGHCSKSPNPSARNPLCAKYFKQIAKLRYKAFINLHM